MLLVFSVVSLSVAVIVTFDVAFTKISATNELIGLTVRVRVRI